MESHLLVAGILIFFGSFIQTVTGFGMAVIAGPILIVIAPQYLPGPIILVGLFLALINVLKYKESVCLTKQKFSFLGLIPGTIVGALLLYIVDVAQLSMFIGVVVLVAVLLSLLPIKIQETPKRLTIAGFLSAFFGTSSGIGGPPMALLMQHQKSSLIRANLAAFFVVSSVLSLLMLIPVGYMSLQHVYLSLPLLPASYLGYRVAIIAINKIPEKMIRTLSLILCLIAGLCAVYSGFISM
ncbi:permease [Psychromonas sp. psych-6C06]|uniref:sulfite exporter TauE/SafE family protein n=1 Tax=Psychromonas sp. psych-6C06 TaxID=2058089 RepID=UPI000C34F233|nr:sulfite exporter TauE/SafE family protein [Psychromonas sp. psych-6C06]PKF61545.1 permease [Psychromonas sp. psych-6C06]